MRENAWLCPVIAGTASLHAMTVNGVTIPVRMEMLWFTDAITRAMRARARCDRRGRLSSRAHEIGSLPADEQMPRRLPLALRHDAAECGPAWRATLLTRQLHCSPCGTFGLV